jgi:hypothetical protein
VADTVAPGSIRVNGWPLMVGRETLRQQLGPPDSAYTAPTPASDTLYCFGDAQLPESYAFEQYGAACYWHRGDTLTFLQTRRVGAPLRVDIGLHRLTEGTTLADLQRLFPASYRHARQREARGRQLLLLFPPAAAATDTWYTLVVENGHLTQFLHVFNCTYD